MTKLRISGIVGVANQVIRVLSMTFTPEQRESLAQRVERSLSQIDALLAGNGARAADLPPPSRRAYEFLKNLDVRIKEETGLPVFLAQDPLTSVVLGTGKMLADMSLLERVCLQ